MTLELGGVDARAVVSGERALRIKVTAEEDEIVAAVEQRVLEVRRRPRPVARRGVLRRVRRLDALVRDQRVGRSTTGGE